MHADGTETVSTVTRDTAWTEEQRQTLYARQALVCPACGRLRAECSDPTRYWYPQRQMCYASANIEATKRRVAKKYEGNEPKPNRLHPTDGMSLWVSPEDLNPDDKFI